jgi:hypothetical protein
MGNMMRKLTDARKLWEGKGRKQRGGKMKPHTASITYYRKLNVTFLPQPYYTSSSPAARIKPDALKIQAVINHENIKTPGG